MSSRGSLSNVKNDEESPNRIRSFKRYPMPLSKFYLLENIVSVIKNLDRYYCREYAAVPEGVERSNFECQPVMIH